MFGSSNDEGEPSGAYGSGGATTTVPNGSISYGSTSSTGTTPAEVEVEVGFQAPQSSQNYVYATNPERDSVAVISAATLGIEVVETGDEPRYLRTIPFRDAALLVDVSSSDIAYIETVNGQSVIQYFQNLPSANAIKVAPDGKHAVAYYDVDSIKQNNFETLQDVTVISFGDAGPVTTKMTTGFKAREVNFAGDATNSPAAYVVTEDGVSILDFAAIDAAKKPGIAQPIAVFTALEPKGADISVTPDGKYALGRIEGTSKLRLVDLKTGVPATLDLATLFGATSTTSGTGGASSLGAGTGGSGFAFAQDIGAAGAAGDTAIAGTAGTNTSGTGGAGTGGAGTGGAATGGAATGGAGTGGAGTGGAATGGAGTGGAATGGAGTGGTSSVSVEVTDLDIAPSGKFALAVVRDRGTLLRLPIPEGFSNPQTIVKLPIQGVTIGSASISPNGSWAVLYTTAVTSERRVVIVDLVGETAPRVVDLTKIIKGIGFSSSGNQAYVAHSRPATINTRSDLSTEEIIDQAYGYSLVDLPKAFRKLQITPADALFSIAVPDTPFVFLALGDENNTVQRLDMDSLQVDELELGSKPISLGVVPSAHCAFASQDYTEGRLTFIDWMSLETKTVTGYELNSKIRE